MRRLSSHATHLVATLAVTAAAVLTAFAMPLPAQALTINLSIGDAHTVTGSGTSTSTSPDINNKATPSSTEGTVSPSTATTK